MNRTSRVHLVVIVVLVCVGLASLGACGSDGDEGAGPSPTARPPTPEGRELTSAVEMAQDLTYHATYRIVGAQPTEGSISVEVWRKGNRVRLDQQLQSQDRVVRTSGFRLEGRTIGCTREDEGDWRCTAVDQTQPSPGEADADPLVGGLVGELSVKELTVATEEVDGRPVRCYKTEDSSRELCVTTDDGIAVRIGTPQSRLELAELEREVDDSIFEPPAEPTQPGSDQN